VTPTSEVKGIWFVSARGYLTKVHGLERVDTVARALLPEHRSIFLDPLPGEWYPEGALQDLLAVLFGHVAMGDEARFVRFVEEASVFGTGKFFRVLLALASTRFLMRRVPVLWGRMRRGAGAVEVAQDDDGTVLHYRAFPYFEDANYRLMTVGTLRGLCKVAGQTSPRVTAEEYGRDWLDVRVEHPARP